MTVTSEGRGRPWWERAGPPWFGELFDEALLRPDDPGEQRVQRLRERILRPPGGFCGRLSIWRARLMTRSYRETEGEPEPIRRARAFLHVATHLPIAIAPERPIAGSPAGHPAATEIEPELMTSWLEREVELDERRMSEPEAIPQRRSVAFDLAEEDRRELEQDTLPCWRTRCIGYRILKELELGFPEAWEYYQQSGAYRRAIAAGLSHIVQDCRAVPRRGLLALQAEVAKDAASYRKSGGGVTLSGGEPLAQPAFGRALLARCRDGNGSPVAAARQTLEPFGLEVHVGG